jgi:hypothetical protein
VRTWREGKVEVSGPVTADGTRRLAFENTPDAVSLAIGNFIPAAKAGVLPIPLAFEHVKGASRQRQARVRLAVDGVEEEFWLAGLSLDPLERIMKSTPNPEKVVGGKGRRVRVTLQPNVYSLGMEVRLRKAQRKLDPGTKQPSYYASTLDFFPLVGKKDKDKDGKADDRKPLQEDVLLALNAPIDVADPVTGRSYRFFQTGMNGPYPAEEVKVESNEPVYISYLTVNYDPGRGLIYVGCLLIVVGIFVRYFVKNRTKQVSPVVP